VRCVLGSRWLAAVLSGGNALRSGAPPSGTVRRRLRRASPPHETLDRHLEIEAAVLGVQQLDPHDPVAGGRNLAAILDDLDLMEDSTQPEMGMGTDPDVRRTKGLSKGHV
jgi:hypothetical protein